ncbi:hypothetical protein [Lutibacter agarilyticus]|nr:hypothetical protein [Lutibacter agarilyticus]
MKFKIEKMTPKQIERIKTKINKIKKALAADKKHWGGHYHDGRGLRYLPPEQYLKIQDYTGALRYFNWFSKNFPDDACYPVFLLEWTITLFMTKRKKQAEQKLIQTFKSNTYIIDKFLNKDFKHLDKTETSNWEFESLVEGLPYSNTQEELLDFTNWLEKFIVSDQFLIPTNKFLELQILLKKQTD